jgi:hypothetical protein
VPLRSTSDPGSQLPGFAELHNSENASANDFAKALRSMENIGDIRNDHFRGAGDPLKKSLSG